MTRPTTPARQRRPGRGSLGPLEPSNPIDHRKIHGFPVTYKFPLGFHRYHYERRPR